MRVPSYRKHSSGQARVTINGKDHLLGPYGSAASKEAYGRLIAEYNASNQSASFGKAPGTLLMEDVLLAYVRHAKAYYQRDDVLYQAKLAVAPLAELYGSYPAKNFGAAEFKAVRQWWLREPEQKLKKDGKPQAIRPRSRQYVNDMMKKTLRIIKWAVSEGMIPGENYTAIKCVDPLRRGHCAAREADKVTSVDAATVEATLPHLTQVLADMVRFQQLVGCRPGELVRITPAMVDRSGDVWTITLADHKTAHHGRQRTIYVGPRAQAVLTPYLLRGADSFCFSPIESERQRRAAVHAKRVTAAGAGNRPGYSARSRQARKPVREPGERYDSQSYARAIRYACQRAKLAVWSPNQLRHAAATDIRREFGLDAAQVILGHSELNVTQIYAEQDRAKALRVALLRG